MVIGLKYKWENKVKYFKWFTFFLLSGTNDTRDLSSV